MSPERFVKGESERTCRTHVLQPVPAAQVSKLAARPSSSIATPNREMLRSSPRRLSLLYPLLLLYVPLL